MAAEILNLEIFEERFRNLFHEALFSAALLAGDDFKVEMANAISLELWGKDSSIIGKPLLDGVPEMRDQPVYQVLKNVYETGQTVEGKEQTAYLHKGDVLQKVFVNFVFKAIKNPEGVITGVLAVGYDVTEQVEDRKRIQQSDMRARVAIEAVGLGTFERDFVTGQTITSPRFDEIFGFARQATHEEYISRIHPEDLLIRKTAHEKALQTGRLHYDARAVLPGNIIRWVRIHGSIIKDEKNEPVLLIGTALDITEEKLSFDKIQESEQKFRTLITETPEVGVGLYIGPELQIQYVNDVMLSFWGKSNSVVGKKWSEALPDFESQGFSEQPRNVFASGIALHAKEVKTMVERDGVLEVAYYNYSYKPLRDHKGEIYAIHHMAVDVTEQVKAKLRLIESEQSVRNLFEQTPVGIAMFNGPDLVVTMVNETLLSYWGRKRESVINRPIFEALPEVAEQGVREIANQVYRTGVAYDSPETTLTLNYEDGRFETIIVKFGFQALKDWQGNITGLLAIANNVTDLVRARQKVEKNELRLQGLANSMPQVVWIAEADGRVTYYNNRVQEFAGVRQNEDGTWIWEAIVHPEDLRPTHAAWSHSVETQTPYEIEHRILMQDGAHRWHLSRAYAYETDEGIKWYGTATDVHDQKVLEMNLETIVRERTLELQRSNDDLQQFAHVASHDLKEPVRKIKTFSFKLQDEYRSTLGERGNNFVNKIISASERMSSMINGVLNYASMPSSGNVEESIDLNKVIDHVQSDLEILMAEKRANIIFTGLPSIRGTKDLIHQLFYNLINNSLKFAKADSPAEIKVTSDIVNLRGQIFHEIILQDNGIGFDQSHAENIFTSFVRLNSKDQYEGSGLGLALCKKIVERHHGTITAKSEMGKGAQFRILLPK